ncbi:MAG: chromosomal replication initiator protein DnaA [Rickettsiales bacterium]|nr:chromosomal replication initiator protein DnaA [Rickettsiales bacterium]
MENSIKTEQNLETKTDSEFLSNLINICCEEFGEELTKKWLSTLTIHTITESELILVASSKFLRDWIIREFVEIKSKINLKKIAQKINPKIKKVSVIHLTKKKTAETKESISNNQEAQSSGKVKSISKYDNIFAFGTDLNPRFNFKNFITAQYNKLAVSMAKIASGFKEQNKIFDDNIPLFIHGSVGMGKTHLGQAIAWEIKEKNKNKKVIYLSAEKFMFHFVQSIRSNELISFKEKMRSIDVLIVDDLQFIAGKQSTQQEFMNSFNSLVDDNKQVILICDRAPNDLENIDEKLKSKISGGMVINFRNADYQDRLTIIKAKAIQHFEKENAPIIPQDVLELFAKNITANIRDLESALKKIIAEKVILNQEINIESAYRILKDYTQIKNPVAVNDVNKIKKIVAEFYGIKLNDMISSSRMQNTVRARQIAIFLTKELTNLSLSQIGNYFGNKHHATIIHSYKLIKKLISTQLACEQQINLLIDKIKS